MLTQFDQDVLVRWGDFYRHAQCANKLGDPYSGSMAGIATVMVLVRGTSEGDGYDFDFCVNEMTPVWTPTPDGLVRRLPPKQAQQSMMPLGRERHSTAGAGPSGHRRAPVTPRRGGAAWGAAWLRSCGGIARLVRCDLGPRTLHGRSTSEEIGARIGGPVAGLVAAVSLPAGSLTAAPDVLRCRAMAAITSFYDWLTKQKRLRTPLGDLARTAARDESFPRDIATLDALLDYVRASSKGSAQAVVVARSAYQAYERSQRPAPK